MRRLLVLGDTHIPDRALRVPKELEQIIERFKPWEIIVFTGDLTSRDVLNWLQNLGEKVYVVKGNMDYLPLPKTYTFEVEGFKIGVHHGDGVHPRGDRAKLTEIARMLDANILVSGHTHMDFIKRGSTGRELLLNPGSLTGVWGGGGSSFTPSFMVLEIMDNKEINISTYKLQGGNPIKTVNRAYKLNGDWAVEEQYGNCY